MYLFGGGHIGFTTSSTARITEMQGLYDALVSRDGITWTQINYQEGGPPSLVPRYSSQEWAKGIINGNVVYVGVWGMTALHFKSNNDTVSPS